ncbi:MAG TPA: hypothetical protein VGK86_05250 [Thermoanaerobaculia bacterium]
MVLGLAQPVTLATDYALGFAAVAGAFLLARGRRGASALPVHFWAAGFFALGVAAFLGGTWHGFSPRLSAPGGALLWKATLAATGCASFFLVAGAALGSVRRRTAAAVAGAAAVKLGIFLLWAASHDDYYGVILDSAAAMVAILVLQSLAWTRRRAPSVPWIVAGILLSFAAAAVEALGFSPGRQFSHDDLYHVVQIGALYLLYRGGRLLETQPA